ncbi:phzF family phenazine biosynthesis protein [Asticcacaulis biprosthecium C19]|uniref:PhzF family phenazine biosynthesis protein n=1 Tax=Asticcacaulis biprosthecium C19 TaxID=715226 RepID=F4QRX2_9CAUL|nr:phzF family phenazine biosynthesis protein [Asticcacaulis biprosthecium C19]
MGIDEDPATGSMHCMLTPLYHRLTGRSVFNFYQAHPKRGAEIQGELAGNRVLLRGHAVTVVRAELVL